MNHAPWEQEKALYTFVDELEALRPKIKGAGNLARFDYWLNQFRYLRTMGWLGCLRGEFDKAFQAATKQPTAEAKRSAMRDHVLPLRIKLARGWERLITDLLAVTDTPGELGTISNLEQHTRRNYWVGRRNNRSFYFLKQHDTTIAKILGEELPAEVHPTTEYLGQPRIIVPAVRSQTEAGEALNLKVIVLDNARPSEALLRVRTMGRGEWRSIPLRHMARAVYEVELPSPADSSLEYYIAAKTAAGEPLRWPATAPALNQTVVVMP